MAEDSEVAREVEMTAPHHLSITSVLSYRPKVSVASAETLYRTNLPVR